MSSVWLPLVIFFLRIVDVPAGTIRVIYMVRGQRTRAALLSFVEASAYIFAVVKVIQKLSENQWNILAYAAGYAVGTYIGITLEQWLATGWIVARIACRDKAAALAEQLRVRQFGVTTLRAEGREGELSILFIVAPRKRGHEILDIAREVDSSAFVTLDPVSQAIGGYLPRLARPMIVSK